MIRTRIAPSPTGLPHIGTAYQALFDYAFAKKRGGKFILRIEDTDVKRTVKGAEKAICESLEWLGLNPDEGPYRQSERLDLYKKHAHLLVKKGNAYYCFCSSARLKKIRQEQQKQGKPPKYDRKCRDLDLAKASSPYVIRMKIPDNQKIVVNDLIRGKVVFDSNLIDDQIILKSDGFPTYHLAVVVDDHLMKISHMVRGEEWLSSAPKHVLLYQYFGWHPPKFIHTPLLRNPDKSKLSKRQGHTSIFWYQEQGYLKDALLNFLSLLGWSHPKNKEVFSLKEFIKYFDFIDLSPVGPVFDLKKLDWLNALYIRKQSRKELVRLLKPWAPKEMNASLINKTIPLVQERMIKLSNYPDLVDFLIKEIKYPANLLIQKKADKKLVKKQLDLVIKELKKIKWNLKNITQSLQVLCEKNNWKRGQFFMTIRVAVTGKTITPPLFESIDLLDRAKTLARLQKALQKLA